MEHQEPDSGDGGDGGGYGGDDGYHYEGYDQYHHENDAYNYDQQQHIDPEQQQQHDQYFDPLQIEGFDPSIQAHYDDQQQAHHTGGEQDLNFQEQEHDYYGSSEYDPQQHYQEHYDPQQYDPQHYDYDQVDPQQQHYIDSQEQHYDQGQIEQPPPPPPPEHGHDAWSGIHETYDHLSDTVHEAYDHATHALHDAYDHARDALDGAVTAVKTSHAYEQASSVLHSAYDQSKQAVEAAWDKVKATQAYGRAAEALDHTRQAVEGALETVKAKLPAPVVKAYDQARAMMEVAVDHTKAALETVKTKAAPTVTSMLSQLPFKTDRNSLVLYACSIGFVILIFTVVCIAMKPKGKGPEKPSPKESAKPKVVNYDELVGAVTIGPPVYDYSSGTNGPLNWGSLSKDWFLCSSGDRQSPIDLSSSAELDKSLTLDRVYGYPMGSLKSGRFIYELDFPVPGGNLVINGQKFRLYNIYFHMPSEHMIDSKRFKMEMQLVHITDQGGAYAVIAVFFESGEVSNPFIGEIMRWKPTTQLNTNNLQLGTDFFRYWGSLTVPPCTQNVIWTVMKDSITASEDQFSVIKAAMQEYNARPTQDLRDRLVSRNS